MPGRTRALLGGRRDPRCRDPRRRDPRRDPQRDPRRDPRCRDPRHRDPRRDPVSAETEGRRPRAPAETSWARDPRRGRGGSRIILTLAALLGTTACTEPDLARRASECIAPAAAGGGWDLTCRVTARILGDLGLIPGAMPTLNMPGAGGGVAFAHTVAQRAGDPNVLVAASPATTLRLAQGQFGHLEATDVRWIGALGTEYGIVAVDADAPWHTLGDLLGDWARAPDRIVASGGSAVAGQDHMKLLLLGREAGVDPLRIRYVPFDGGGEALTALLGGFVQVFSGELSEIESHLETGSIRVLAVLAPERLDGLLADVPTATEQGYPVEWVTWRGFYVPGGISDEGYAAWVARLREVGASEAWAAARDQSRLRPYFLVGGAFEAFVMRQVEEFRDLARDLGLIE